MKTGLNSVFYALVSNAALACCFLPFVLLAWKDIRKIPAYRTLGIYWFLNGLDNLLEVWMSSAREAGFVHQFSFYHSLLEDPLILLVFVLARDGRSKRPLLFVLAGLVAGECILVGESGRGHLLLMLGTGLAMVILSSVAGMWEYLKKMEHTRFENSMAFVYAAVLFFYGSTLIIYVFTHFHFKSATDGQDSYLLYYIGMLLSAAVTCAGLWSYGVRRPHEHPWSPPSGYSSSSS